MTHTLAALLRGTLTGRENILPFLWTHGEPEPVIREYMAAIDRSGIGAVCVESRPHPDFLGPQWWHDMDVILDEARGRNMRVWILDDSHFPTGYANGALEAAPPELCRQSLVRKCLGTASPGQPLALTPEECAAVEDWAPNQMEGYMAGSNPPRVFSDDRFLGVAAVKEQGGPQDILDLTERASAGEYLFAPQEGRWAVYALSLTRNRGPHRNYINMMDRASCRMLIDTVYEAHWAHYQEDFGRTIAGFFSDEPEIGNGHLYESGKPVWQGDDQAWSREVEEELRARWGSGFVENLPLLWENPGDSERSANARRDYMDTVTRAVQRNFSGQIGDWCRAHGVEYIGHLIEDNNQHLRTGSSLGHYFRGLWGQDMAGIDDIGGQVLPQGEWIGPGAAFGQDRNGLFYHFVLGKLGASLAALDPKKQGRCMCELFGAYGWEAGVRLQKYLCDHFLVRGVNRFVPHAFSMKDYPDPDCPPHFYAHGHNPLYRHFGALMGYLGRMSAVLSGGRHMARAAVLYNAEADWMGPCMALEELARPLAEAQVEFDFVPIDALTDREAWNTSLDQGFTVNGQRYEALFVPGCDWLPGPVGELLAQAEQAGCRVCFVGRRPRPAGEGQGLERFSLCKPEELGGLARELGLAVINAVPESRYLRCMRYEKEGEDPVFFVVNEAAEPYRGTLTLPVPGPCWAYNAWLNRGEALSYTGDGSGTRLEVELLPGHSLTVVLGEAPEKLHPPVLPEGAPEELDGGWVRSICKSAEYPRFREEKSVTLPDRLAEEEPLFSGFVRYEREYLHQGGEAVLEVTDAYEGAELFLNGESLGIQVAPPFRWPLDGVKAGSNRLRLEIATTLERETSNLPNPMAAWLGQEPQEPSCPSGINGRVRLWHKS